MTLDKTNELIAMHAQPGGDYNRNAVRMAGGVVMRDHAHAAVDQLIRDYVLEQKSGIRHGMHVENTLK